MVGNLVAGKLATSAFHPVLWIKYRIFIQYKMERFYICDISEVLELATEKTDEVILLLLIQTNVCNVSIPYAAEKRQF